MLPYKSILPIDKASRMPIYIQIANGMIQEILSGRIKSGLKLPGTRTLSTHLGLHRKTIVAVYEELEAQGWIEIVPAKGTYVSKKIPISKAKKFQPFSSLVSSPLKQSGFVLKTKSTILPEFHSSKIETYRYRLDDGFPDIRLAPIQSLSRHYKSILSSKSSFKKFNYTDEIIGNIHLRQELVKYLSETRSINVTPANIMIVRGAIMGFYLLFHVILEKGDHVIVGETNYDSANRIIQNAKGKLIPVRVDDDGIDVDQVETLCKKKKIRAIYIVPHHHHPTTVSLSAERRMKLLMLAERFKFAIIEDDYDYDFHYASSPILPLASSDQQGLVAYVGSFSKTIAPAFRIGFVVAPENLIREMGTLRRYIDRQGDTILERSIAFLFQEGEIRRHMRKALKTYRYRRDFFCRRLKETFGDSIQFKVPEGGLAVWVKFDQKIDLTHLRATAKNKSLYLTNSQRYNPEGQHLNATRMGFASMNEAELSDIMDILKAIV